MILCEDVLNRFELGDGEVGVAAIECFERLEYLN